MTRDDEAQALIQDFVETYERNRFVKSPKEEDEALLRIALRYFRQREAAMWRECVGRAETWSAQCPNDDRREAYRLFAHWCESKANELEP